MEVVLDDSLDTGIPEIGVIDLTKNTHVMVAASGHRLYLKYPKPGDLGYRYAIMVGEDSSFFTIVPYDGVLCRFGEGKTQHLKYNLDSHDPEVRCKETHSSSELLTFLAGIRIGSNSRGSVRSRGGIWGLNEQQLIAMRMGSDEISKEFGSILGGEIRKAASVQGKGVIWGE
jgi:hypothetical protein